MKLNPAKLKFYAFIALIVLILLTSFIFHLTGNHFLFYKDLKQISSGILLPIFYVSLYVISSFFPIVFLTFFGALIFPFYEVFILSIIGNLISFIIVFYTTRSLGREYIEIYEKNHPKLNKLDIRINENGFLYIFLLRISFVIPPTAISILAGLSKIKFKEYILSSILGTIPVIFSSILLIKGYQIKEFSLVIISLILFVLFVALPFFLIKELRRYFKKK